MSLAIDYWDYLGWKDTLALKGHGKRQQAYARVRGDREVYTPQVVVNGVMHVAGSDKAAIERAIEQTQRDAGAMHVPVTLTVAGDKLTVEVPAAAQMAMNRPKSGSCPITKKIPVAIERGENRGHTITYSNVVRQLGQARRMDRQSRDLQRVDQGIPERRNRLGCRDRPERRSEFSWPHAGRKHCFAALIAD